MAASTRAFEIPNVDNTTVLSVNDFPGVLFFNTDTNSVQYKDNSFNVKTIPSDGGGTPIAQQLWVNATSGNDANTGDIDSAKASYEAARLAAVAIGSPTNYVVINIIGDQSITGDLIVSPYIVVDGHNSGVITASGDMVIDPAFIPLSNDYAIFKNCAFALNSINLDWSTSENNALYLLNCTYPNVPDLLIKNDPSTTSGCFVVFDGRSPLLSPFSTSFLVQDSTVAAFNLLFNTTNPKVLSTAGRDSSLLLENCGNYGSPEINAMSTGSAILSIRNCSPTSVLLSGTTASLQTDVLSTSGVGFSGGATISQVNYLTAATSLVVDPIYYTPSNYTPESPAAQIPVDGIVSHLKGINTALGPLVTSPLVAVIGTMLTGTTVYTSGVQASVIATIDGSKTIPANSLLVGESVELSLIGLRSGIVTGGSGVITCQFGPLTFDSISMSTTLGGVSSIRSWNLTFKVTRVASSSVSISAAGFFEDDAHLLKSMQLYSTPAVHTGFDFTVNNDIDVLYLMTASAGNACNYDAINLNIIKYTT
jgi:hypothetical protein